MTDEEVVRIMHAHFEGLFPRGCPTCGRYFANLRDYILDTELIGDTISYDVELCDWEPEEPLGAAAFANCPCGTTMVLTTRGIPVAQLHGVLRWVRDETGRRGVGHTELIGAVRDEVRRRALGSGEKLGIVPLPAGGPAPAAAAPEA
ncbi:hypothetical protein FO488_04830 [Geobacter sp. FeAm09]|uniref:hypothetical protein n=1 Tax=Geobacter sp. FeAm09 TaxID=2597769 RepID=UPI0011EC3E18|nr:hypothetical protein [Geobacter sp. FeAm09]QEM67537.1 hypothetical protein FO488_04830 [Geobacter sp. FeAm09]